MNQTQTSVTAEGIDERSPRWLQRSRVQNNKRIKSVTYCILLLLHSHFTFVLQHTAIADPLRPPPNFRARVGTRIPLGPFLNVYVLILPYYFMDIF